MLRNEKKQPGRKPGSGMNKRKADQEYSMNTHTVRSRKRIESMTEAEDAQRRVRKSRDQWVRRQMLAWKSTDEYKKIPDLIKKEREQQKKGEFTQA